MTEVELEPGATAFIGRNGQGKTNLVEAIDYLSRLASHRVAGDAPLVRAGAELPRARELVGLVRTVIFAPDDLALVKGDPSGRRAFLDDLLVMRAPRLAG